ncbi:MAG: tRNA (adenosine(37)-N6)-threonylcarbamoyltransferase complex dimerization subunit type 1 TsaB [Candidatus Krumholzibacteria bacterium]|jgi:tRNA threonylcarbamoyl adenosine modification protein YeaZ|nr:tRNA (adenosine(37)-N6)-threonylcarbamoyltransferase complex dimerization subunit type 1 TsaB [Candidatus Krumholzibacteria bacterium]
MILALDVSSSLGLLSLEVEPGRILSRVSLRPREHRRFLEKGLSDLQKESGRPWSELERVALGIGPGSFTGLRVALATAKGLVFGRPTPILPLSSLAIPVAACESAPILIARPARSREYWSAFFEPGASKPLFEQVRKEEELEEWHRELLADWPGLRLVNGKEPEAELQLQALARLARNPEGELSGYNRDRLLPRYHATASVTRPKGEEA